MNLLQPGWLFLIILPLVMIGLAVLSQKQTSKQWQRIIANRLRGQLVKTSSQAGYWLSIALATIGSVLIIIALARPYSGTTEKEETVQSRNIIIAIDTSRSMLVKDGSPDRITTAKAMALELISAFPGDRVGILAFSGKPLLITPLTVDHEALRETIGQVDTTVIPSGGSDLPAAVRLALDTFRKIDSPANALIVLSDGEDHTEASSLVAQDIARSKVTVSCIGVGKTEGGIIPDKKQPDGKYRDVFGNTVLSRMEPAALEEIAKAGQGIYMTASSSAANKVKSSLSDLEAKTQKSYTTTIPNEIPQHFLIPAVICLILAMITRSNLISRPLRSPVPSTAAILFFLLSVNLFASRDIQRGQDAYEKKEYAIAQQAFAKALENASPRKKAAIHLALGNTAFRQDDWQLATYHFSKALLSPEESIRENTHYNLGNSLFQATWEDIESEDIDDNDSHILLTKGNIKQSITRLEDSIGHYEATLAINPSHEDAKHNLELAKTLLKALKEANEREVQEDQNKQSSDSGDPDPKNNQAQGENTENPENKKGQGEEKNDPNQPDNDQGSNQENPNENKDGEQPENENESQQSDKKPGESDEAFAERQLRNNSDLEALPTKRRIIRLRRPTKDW